MESKSVVVGGGCVEAALSIYLENFATSLSSREQLAIADFAKSLLVIPKVNTKYRIQMLENSLKKINFLNFFYNLY